MGGGAFADFAVGGAGILGAGPEVGGDVLDYAARVLWVLAREKSF
jgi:hypothetical protein